MYISLPSGYELTGLSRGGQQVGKCQEVYAKAVKLLVELASLQVDNYLIFFLNVSFTSKLYLLNLQRLVIWLTDITEIVLFL